MTRPGVRTPAWRLSPLCILIALAGCGAPDGTAPGRQPRQGTAAASSNLPARTEPTKFALLVGCTAYPNLPAKYHLVGPANDVDLTKELLIERFDFPKDNVVVLADHIVVEAEHVAKDAKKPTRYNIERYWKKLAELAIPGDQIVVLMAGHGSQSPQRRDPEDDDLEPDGLDEVFLPRDIGPWDDTVGTVTNAIRDDELRQWVAAIKAKDASLWVIIDACHSGTMTRTDGTKRELEPEALGIPDQLLAEAKSRAEVDDDENAKEETQLLHEETATTRGATGSSGTQQDGPVVVALFAAQSIEPTIEKELPPGGKNRKNYGLLTYTINEILSQAESKMTYRELLQQINRKYRGEWGRVSPTPVLEGNGMDCVVLGLERFPDRPGIQIDGSKTTGFTIDAGALDGITPGSILATYPPAGTANADQPIGHVRVLEDGFKATEAGTEPCEHEGMAAPTELAAGMRCRAVYLDMGDQRLRVCVDTATDKDESLAEDERNRLMTDILAIVSERIPLAVTVDNTEDADWLVRYDSLESKKLFLTPACGWHGQKEGTLAPLFDLAQEGDEFADTLTSSLTSIARAQSLLRVGAEMGGESGSDMKLNVDILRYKDAEDSKGQVVQFGPAGIRLYDGDRIGFSLKNTGRESLDVTALLVDSGFGIHPLYPKPGQTNRLFGGNELPPIRGNITADYAGLEHLVVIAVKGKPVDEPANFSFLAQPTLERSRAAGGENFNSPLGKIFQNALYAEGDTRGYATGQNSEYEIRTLSWSVAPK